MQTLPPAGWPRFLARIAQRHAGQPITLRQRGPGERESQVVLWRAALRGLDATAAAPGATVTLQAGDEPPFIQIVLADVQLIAIRLTATQALDTLRLDTGDGTVTTLAVDRLAGWQVEG